MDITLSPFVHLLSVYASLGAQSISLFLNQYKNNQFVWIIDQLNSEVERTNGALTGLTHHEKRDSLVFFGSL